MTYQLSYKDTVLVSNIYKAQSFKDRLCGLMFTKNLGDRGGLLFESKSLHTHFMRYKLDILFLTKDHIVVDIIRSMKPWRVTRIYWKAKYAIEMRAGVVSDEVKIGDKVDLLCIS